MADYSEVDLAASACRGSASTSTATSGSAPARVVTTALAASATSVATPKLVYDILGKSNFAGVGCHHR